MVTDDEKSELEHYNIDTEKNLVPNWDEIEDLLNFADKLKTKCDDLSDRIFLLNSLRVFLMGTIIGSIICSAFIFSQKGIIFLDPIHNVSIPLIFFLCGFILILLFSLTFVEALTRKFQRRNISDLRALNSIVDLIRENHHLITRNFSELQKIQLKVQLSRFDIETSIQYRTRHNLTL
jgi:ABC-type bacteriocin/lantibiotic exporter with double-glycine peptidase domain